MGAVDTTYTFTATDTITSAKMNNIIDQTTITTDAIIGTTLDVASGKLKIRSAGITSNEMGSNSVVTAAITDANVTQAKLAPNVVGNGPFFIAIPSGEQDLGTGTGDVKITLVEASDTNNNFLNSRFTATISGFYLFCASTNIAMRSGTTSLTSHSSIYKNGNRLTVGAYTSNSSAQFISTSTIITYLNVNDYIELYALRSSNGGCFIGSDTAGTYLTGCLIRSA